MAFEDLKQRQSVMWGAGPFEEIAETIAGMHDALVERLRPRPDERWLDVGTGTGAVAVRAARAGADVTAVDLAPALVETAERQCAEAGLEIRCEVGDAERLSYEDASFDVVASAVGAIFAPDHRAVAHELARVTRPGGRLGLTAWVPDGSIGEMFKMIQPFQPPLPDGVPSPLEWGREEYVEGLLGESFDLTFETLDVPYRSDSGESTWQLFSRAFGPVKTLTQTLDPDRLEEFHRAFVDFHERFRQNGGIDQPRPYLLVLGTRR